MQLAEISFFTSDLNECDQVHIEDVQTEDPVPSPQDLNAYNFAMQDNFRMTSTANLTLALSHQAAAAAAAAAVSTSQASDPNAAQQNADLQAAAAAAAAAQQAAHAQQAAALSAAMHDFV